MHEKPHSYLISARYVTSAQGKRVRLSGSPSRETEPVSASLPTRFLTATTYANIEPHCRQAPHSLCLWVATHLRTWPCLLLVAEKPACNSLSISWSLAIFPSQAMVSTLKFLPCPARPAKWRTFTTA